MAEKLKIATMPYKFATYRALSGLFINLSAAWFAIVLVTPVFPEFYSFLNLYDNDRKEA